VLGGANSPPVLIGSCRSVVSRVGFGVAVHINVLTGILLHKMKETPVWVNATVRYHYWLELLVDSKIIQYKVKIVKNKASYRWGRGLFIAFYRGAKDLFGVEY
jgi:NADH:ubiquinone oxidoreductase subunit H